MEARPKSQADGPRMFRLDGLSESRILEICTYGSMRGVG